MASSVPAEFLCVLEWTSLYIPGVWTMSRLSVGIDKHNPSHCHLSDPAYNDDKRRCPGPQKPVKKKCSKILKTEYVFCRNARVIFTIVELDFYFRQWFSTSGLQSLSQSSSKTIRKHIYTTIHSSRKITVKKQKRK